MIQGNVVEAGALKTVGFESEKFEYEFAILIEFKSAAECKQALADGEVKFTFLGE